MLMFKDIVAVEREPHAPVRLAQIQGACCSDPLALKFEYVCKDASGATFTAPYDAVRKATESEARTFTIRQQHERRK